MEMELFQINMCEFEKRREAILSDNKSHHTTVDNKIDN